MLTVTAYGPPATVAPAAAPALESVTLSTVSPGRSPATLKSVDGEVSSKRYVTPYTFEKLVAVMLSARLVAVVVLVTSVAAM